MDGYEKILKKIWRGCLEIEEYRRYEWWLKKREFMIVKGG